MRVATSQVRTVNTTPLQIAPRALYCDSGLYAASILALISGVHCGGRFGGRAGARERVAVVWRSRSNGFGDNDITPGQSDLARQDSRRGNAHARSGAAHARSGAAHA